MSARQISVVVPVYNEHENIATCLRGLWAALSGVEHEILVVYDFDGDTTLGAIAAMPDPPPSLRLVKNTIGKGAANAIRAGFAAAAGDVVVTTMADLSDPPEKILELAEKMRSSGAAVVAGSRYMAGGEQFGGPLIKRTLSRIAGLSLHWIGGVGTHDATNNFKAYSRDFLQRIVVEAQGAFDIGLEITVKAHLAAAGVEEVPTTWRDRSAGESRFKVWAWAPKYLRWYWMAMGAPIAVLLVWLAAWAIEARASDWTGGVLGIEPAISTAFALTGLGALWLARRARGRVVPLDALVALAWSNPLHAWLHHAGWTWLGPVLALAATFGVWAASFGPQSWRRLRARVGSELTWRNAVFVLLTLAIWPVMIQWPQLDHSIRLDPSWQRAFDHFFLTEPQSGTESIFTYGPLGGLHTLQWGPNTFWARALLIEGLVKLGLAAFFVAAAFTMRGWLERVLWFVALLYSRASADSVLLIAITGVGVALLGRRRVIGPSLFVAAGVLVTLGFTKFTFQMLALVAVVLVALETAWRRPVYRALGWLAIFALIYLGLWCAAGQNPLHLPAYLRGSLEIAKGYGASQCDPELLTDFTQPLWTAGLLAGACLARVLASRGSVRSFAVCALTFAAMFLAYKAGAIKTPIGRIFHETAIVVPLAVLAGMEEEAARRRLWTWLARGLAIAAAVVGSRGSISEQMLEKFGAATFSKLLRRELSARLPSFSTLPQTRDALEAGDAAARQRYDMPRTRALVGQEPIDIVGVAQALATFNGLNYRARPVLQSYSVHTRYLIERNVEHFEGPDAPRFVLLRMENFQGFMGWTMEPLVYEAVLRRYRPRLVEWDHLLLERDDSRPARAQAEPRVLLERDLPVGEWVDVPPNPGGATQLRLDVQTTSGGALYSFLARGLLPTLELRFKNGQFRRHRITMAIAREGWLIEPYFETQFQLVRWLGGESLAEVASLRWLPHGDRADWLAPSAKLTLSALEPLPRPEPLPLSEQFPWITPAPSQAQTSGAVWTRIDGLRPALSGMPPFRARLDAPAGRYRWRFVLASVPGGAFESSDGMRVRVVRSVGGTEETLSETLVPKHDADDPPPALNTTGQTEFDAPGWLELRIDGGPAGSLTGDYFVLHNLRLVPLEDGEAPLGAKGRQGGARGGDGPGAGSSQKR